MAEAAAIELAHVQEVKASHEAELLALPNVVGVGVGYKEKGGKTTDTFAVMVYVRRKYAVGSLRKGEVVPSNLSVASQVAVPPPPDGSGATTAEVTGAAAVTDVKEVGEIQAQAYTAQVRPAPLGYSLGHYAITAGSFGALVRDTCAPCRIYLLSNNHVLANSNAASPGDPVLQPGAFDGGAHPKDTVARPPACCSPARTRSRFTTTSRTSSWRSASRSSRPEAPHAAGGARGRGPGDRGAARQPGPGTARRGGEPRRRHGPPAGGCPGADAGLNGRVLGPRPAAGQRRRDRPCGPDAPERRRLQGLPELGLGRRLGHRGDGRRPDPVVDRVRLLVPTHVYDVGGSNSNTNHRQDLDRYTYNSYLLGGGDWAFIRCVIGLYAYARGSGSYAKNDFATGSANYLCVPHVYVV